MLLRAFPSTSAARPSSSFTRLFSTTPTRMASSTPMEDIMREKVNPSLSFLLYSKGRECNISN